MPRKRRAPGTFGTVEKLPSGRYRARYWGPDRRHHSAPTLFLTKKDARAWLALKHAEIIEHEWLPPQARRGRSKLTLAAYADTWLKTRLVKGEPLRPRTKAHYRRVLDQQILPKLGSMPLTAITDDTVQSWYADLPEDTPTARAHAYSILRAIMTTAVEQNKITANPCALRGAGSSARVHKIRPATLAELDAITAAMPPEYQAMVLLASWCALRYGELTELRRGDIDLKNGVVRVSRAVVRVDGAFDVGEPKSRAGVRDVAIPPHLLPAIEDHLTEFVEDYSDALLFPSRHGDHLAAPTLYRHWFKAREAAGRPDLRFHDLRDSGAVLAAATGATLAELMARLGHSTVGAAMRYQDAAHGRDREIAALLSKLAEK